MAEPCQNSNRIQNIEAKIISLDAVVNGNGRPGLKTDFAVLNRGFSDFIREYQNDRDENRIYREKREALDELAEGKITRMEKLLIAAAAGGLFGGGSGVAMLIRTLIG